MALDLIVGLCWNRECSGIGAMAVRVMLYGTLGCLFERNYVAGMQSVLHLYSFCRDTLPALAGGFGPAESMRFTQLTVMLAGAVLCMLGILYLAYVRTSNPLPGTIEKEGAYDIS